MNQFVGVVGDPRAVTRINEQPVALISRPPAWRKASTMNEGTSNSVLFSSVWLVNSFQPATPIFMPDSIPACVKKITGGRHPSSADSAARKTERAASSRGIREVWTIFVFSLPSSKTARPVLNSSSTDSSKRVKSRLNIQNWIHVPDRSKLPGSRADALPSGSEFYPAVPSSSDRLKKDRLAL